MGCFKLTYREELPTLKVVKGFSFSLEKSCAGLYRYGFGGQEMDNEINGVTGSSYTAEFWQYDSRLGRRWNRDPITYPWQSTYAVFNNNPIVYTDPLGLFGTRKEGRKDKKANGRKGRVRKDKTNGGFEIYNKKNRTTISKDNLSSSGYAYGKVAGKNKNTRGTGLFSNPVYRMMKLNGVTDFGTGIHYDKNYVHKESQWMKDFNRVVNGALYSALTPAGIGILGPSLLVRQSLTSLGVKTGVSALIQALTNGEVNVVGAISDGLLVPGASDFAGAAFELNIGTQGISTRSILGTKKSNEVVIEASISILFNMGLSGASKQWAGGSSVAETALSIPGSVLQTETVKRLK